MGVALTEALALYGPLAFPPSQGDGPLRLGLAQDYPLAYPGGDTQICADLYRFLNADDRPDRYIQRSLCAGDVIRLVDYPQGRDQPRQGPVRWYVLESVGVRRIPMPRLFASAQDAFYATREDLGVDDARELAAAFPQ